jgi:hypothetical protein
MLRVFGFKCLIKKYFIEVACRRQRSLFAWQKIRSY